MLKTYRPSLSIKQNRVLFDKLTALGRGSQLECPLIPQPECPTFADDLHTHMDETTNLTIISQLPKVKVALEENGHAFRHITFCLCRIRRNGINPKEY